jgi:hypothetical protein
MTLVFAIGIVRQSDDADSRIAALPAGKQDDFTGYSEISKR